jgi:hypothetical protein
MIASKSAFVKQFPFFFSTATNSNVFEKIAGMPHFQL